MDRNQDLLLERKLSGNRSLCARLAQENIKDDIVKTLTLLQDMKHNDLFMEVRFAVNDDGKIKSMLWCTGKNKTDYAVWGCGYL